MPTFLRLSAVLTLAACGAPADPPSGDADPLQKVTYHRDVRPLVDQHCTGCHSEGNIGGFRLDTPEDALRAADAMVLAVEERSMPPWGMDPDCRPTAGDLTLSLSLIHI